MNMKQSKKPRRPMTTYYLIAIGVVLALNFFILPWLASQQVRKVDYGTFMKMTNEKNIGLVEVQSNKIVFTDKDQQDVYETGLMDDNGLVDRLYEAGAVFSSKIVAESSPFLNFLLSWLIPIGIFLALGSFMRKKLNDRENGNAMMFGGGMFGPLGKSNAKVYVKSSGGIRFADVAGEDEAKENLQEIVSYLHDPGKYKAIGASMPKGVLLVGPPGTGKTMLADRKSVV